MSVYRYRWVKWNEKFGGADILIESDEKTIQNMGRALSGLFIQLCLLMVIMTTFVIYDIDLNYSLDQ